MLCSVLAAIAWEFVFERYFAAIMSEVLKACGHNPDLCLTVTGFGDAGAALVASPSVDKIIFTGSPEVYVVAVFDPPHTFICANSHKHSHSPPDAGETLEAERIDRTIKSQRRQQQRQQHTHALKINRPPPPPLSPLAATGRAKGDGRLLQDPQTRGAGAGREGPLRSV